ncbi:MAG: DUF1700 domain-containing protein [Anaerolineaceae bacterium]|nr:DUF1700 domain-containing protein [Anaerolineaceae bacterium]
MTRTEFLQLLAQRLAALPEADKGRVLGYYDEMIQDRVEDGLPEREAVAALGGLDKIVEDSMLEMPIPTLLKARVNSSKSKAGNKGLWVALAIIGFPIWGALLIGVIAIYLAIWALVLTLYAVLGALGVSVFGMLCTGIWYLFTAYTATGLTSIGISAILAGVTLFMVKPLTSFSRALIQLTAKLALSIKSSIIDRSTYDEN